MTERRTEINDLPREEHELGKEEAQAIVGGRIRPVTGGGTVTGLAEDLTQSPNQTNSEMEVASD